MTDAGIRDHVRRLLDWEDAHAGFDKAVAGIAPAMRGAAPPGLPYWPWQLLEHLRIAQRDILEFCRNPHYEEMEWPKDYWPSSAAPSSEREWDDSIRGFSEDRRALQDLAMNPELDLTTKIPHGQGQTYLRELLLVADHTAYHVGQLVIVRRLLGIWT